MHSPVPPLQLPRPGALLLVLVLGMWVQHLLLLLLLLLGVCHLCRRRRRWLVLLPLLGGRPLLRVHQSQHFLPRHLHR